MKYLLRLKSGKTFIINAAMKDEIEDAAAAKRGNRVITVANQAFALSNIAFPIEDYGKAAPAPAEKVRETYHEKTLIKVDGEWQETTDSEVQLKRDRRIFRTQRIGDKTGNIVSDLMTLYDGPYESVRDMLRAA